MLELGEQQLLADDAPAGAGVVEPFLDPPLLPTAEHRVVVAERGLAAQGLAVAARVVGAVLAVVEHRELGEAAVVQAAVDPQLVAGSSARDRRIGRCS